MDNLAVEAVHGAKEVTFTLKRETKTVLHPYFGFGDASGFVFNQQEGPLLVFNVGQTITFDQSDPTNLGHEIRLYKSHPTDTQYNVYNTEHEMGEYDAGWTYADANLSAGQEGFTKSLTITKDFPQVLYYESTASDRAGWIFYSTGSYVYCHMKVLSHAEIFDISAEKLLVNKLKFNNLDLQFRLNKRKPEVRDGSGIVNFNVKVKQKTNNHPNIGYGDLSGYIIDEQESPYIEFLPGYTYRFHQNDPSNKGYRMKFYRDYGKVNNHHGLSEYVGIEGDYYTINSLLPTITGNGYIENEIVDIVSPDISFSQISSVGNYNNTNDIITLNPNSGTARVNIINLGPINTFSITNAGTGYKYGEEVGLSGEGTGSSGLTLINGQITDISMISGGQNYQISNNHYNRHSQCSGATTKSHCIRWKY